MEKQRERLIDLLNRHCALRQENNDCTNETTEDCSTCLADFLLANGVIVPPCKVGDTVYQTDGVRVYESTVKTVLYVTNGIAFDESAIGSSVFLKREEAALKGGVL